MDALNKQVEKETLEATYRKKCKEAQEEYFNTKNNAKMQLQKKLDDAYDEWVQNVSLLE